MTRLDGLRAVAIVMVIALHHDMLKGYGWAGVDLFFVLSGLLITRILRAMRDDELYWKPFYTKRFFRIAPPLAALLCIAIFTVKGLNLPGMLLYTFFLGNLAEVTHHGILLLSPLWSLAVEEHFYLIWPVAIRFLSRRHLILLAVGIIVAEPILRLVATGHVNYYLTIYELTPFRLDGLAAGSLLALTVDHPHARLKWERSSPVLAISGLALLCLLPIFVPNFSLEVNSALFNSLGYSLVILVSVAVIAWVYLKETSWLSRMLALPPLVIVGQVSYGMYLYHRVVMSMLFKFLHVPLDHLKLLMLLDLPITFMLSYASFRLYERPMIDYGHALVQRQKTASQAVAVPLG